MAYIGGILGSGGYGTAPLGNLTSGLEAIQKTQIASRIQEIQQQKAWDRDDRLRDEKFALEMSLPKYKEDMRANLANKTILKVKEYNDKLLNYTKAVESGKRIGAEERMQKQLELVSAKNELIQSSESAKAFIDSFDKAQSYRLQIRDKLDANERAEYDKKWMELNEKIKHPVLSEGLSSYDVMVAAQPPEPGAYKTYNDMDKEIKSAASNVYTKEGLRSIIDAHLKARADVLMPLGVSTGDYADEQQMSDFFFERNKGLIRRTPTGGGGVNLGFGLGRNPIEYESKPTPVANKEYNMVSVPVSESQPDRTYALGGAVNLTTGEKTTRLDKAKVVGLSVSDNKIILKSGGGLAKSDNELALFREGDRPSFYQGKWENGIPISEFDNEATQKTALTNEFSRQNKDVKGKPEITDVRINKTEDGVTISGNATSKSGFMGMSSKTTPVSVTYKTAVDPRPESFYETTLFDNKELVSNLIKTMIIDGKPLGQYFDEYKKNKPQTTSSKPELVTQKGVTYRLNKTTGEYEPI